MNREEVFLNGIASGDEVTLEPMTRKELWYAAISGENVTPPDPMTRIEVYLDDIYNGDASTLEPMTRVELFLAKISGADVDIPDPMTRLEMYLAKLCGENVTPPDPMTREELWLAYWIEQKTDTNLMHADKYIIGSSSNYAVNVGTTLSSSGSTATVSGNDPIVVDITAGWRGAVFISDEMENGKSYDFTAKTSCETGANRRLSLYVVDGDYKVLSRISNFSGTSADDISKTYTATAAGQRFALSVESSTVQAISVSDLTAKENT